MIKQLIKISAIVVGILFLLDFVIYPALTAANTLYNVLGSLSIFALAVFIIYYGLKSSGLDGGILDNDEMRQIYEARLAQGKPTIMPESLKDKPKRKYTKKTK